MFFYSLLLMTGYMTLRAAVSLFFAQDPSVLALGYILSHVFLGFAASYLLRFAVASFSGFSLASKFFYLSLLLFASDIALNVFLPNAPVFHRDLNIIEWGTNKYVGIYHTILLWLVFLSAGFIFVSKASQNRKDYEIRTRSLTIAAGIFLAIVVVIPRNIFHTPLFITISDIGYAFSFGIVLLGLGHRFQEKKIDKL